MTTDSICGFFYTLYLDNVSNQNYNNHRREAHEQSINKW